MASPQAQPRQVPRGQGPATSQASTSQNVRLVLLAAIGLLAAVVVPVFLTNSTLAWLESKNFFGTNNMAIKNVAVAGGTGTLGTPIVEQLVKAGFTVTVLTREGSTSTPPAGIAAAKPVDYTSVASLSAALAGQDAVVSVLGSLAVGEQKPLVDAAVAVGSVKRFIPSEFGVNTRKTPGSTIGTILSAKTGIVDYLAETALAHPDFTWTGISTGHFFDWGLARGALGFDAKTKTATIYDSGNERFGTSNLAYIGKAVAAVLKQAATPADKTANKYIEIASFTPTQNELLAAAEAVSGSTWTVRKVAAADAQKTGEDKLSRGDFSAFIDLLSAWQFADGAGHAPDLADPASGNQLLGLAPEDFKASVTSWLKG